MLRISNTLTRVADEVRTLEPGVVRMYTCGPTVYRYAHIGNLRSYLMADWIRRVLEHHGLDVVQIKNITDVGHMRQEMLEVGGDRVILAALEEGKTPEEIAQFYADAFLQDEARLNILPATHNPWATQHVPEMVEIVRKLFENGYAYQAGGNIYFDVARFENYGQLSGNLEQGLMEGVRMEVDPLKRDARDFTLWKLAEPGREMKWPSPWGEGFPGWHIECSAMATKYLGEQLDLHTGGVDNIFPHHEDEIAQSEAAFGKQYVRHWVHGQHLLADGVKMSKSSGNVFILDDLVDRGFDPLSFRYLCLSVRYRHRLDFTFSALKGAERALTGLRDRVAIWRTQDSKAEVPEDLDPWRENFLAHVDNDLNLPEGLATMWNMAKSPMSDRSKLTLLTEWDQILGLGLSEPPAEVGVPDTVQSVLTERAELRKNATYEPADDLRAGARSDGYVVRDTPDGTWSRAMTPFELVEERYRSVSSPGEVESYISRPSSVEFSMLTVVSDYLEDVKRCTESALRWAEGYSAEMVIVDNGSTDGTGDWLEELKARDPRVRVVHCDHVLGEGAAKNIGLAQCLGETVVIVDPSVEVQGDVLGPLAESLKGKEIGMVGPWALSTDDMHHFHDEVSSGEADAMQAYCQAFPRSLINDVGLMREGFRFYRNLDLDFSFQVKAEGYRIEAVEGLPMVRHEHRTWAALDEAQRDELSLKNFRRFFKRWGERADLLVVNKQSQD